MVSKKSHLFIAIFVLILATAPSLFLPTTPIAYAAIGDVNITVTDELGSSLSGATVTINCDGIAVSLTDGLDGDASSNGTIVVPGATAVVVGCSEGETMTQLDIEKDGYVTSAASGDLVWNALSENNNSVSLAFSYKITGVSTEALESDITGSASGLVVGDGTGTNTCSLSGGVWYCPVTLANSNEEPSGTVTLNGYVAEALDLEGAGTRSDNTDAQISTTLTSVKYAQKVTSENELSASITGATVTVGGTSCTENTGVYYCATPLASDGGSDDVIVTLDGYVTYTDDSTDRTANSDAQATYTSANLFAHKVTGQDELGTSLTGATVTVGGISCTESSGTYYCATPLASDGGTNDVIITKDGYVTYIDDSTNRTGNTDAQATYTSGNLFTYKLTGITTEVLAADVTASVSGLVVGDSTGTNTCSLSGGAWYCPVLLVNSNEEASGTVTLDGYVTEVIDLEGTGVRNANTDSQVSTTLAGLKYAHKVTGQDELGSSLTGATVTVGGTSCTESSGVYYCATTLANDGGGSDVIITKDGYVTYIDDSTNRSSSSDVQATYTSENLFAYKLTTISTEVLGTDITASISSLLVGDSTGTNTCSLSGGAWYCPVVLANSNEEPAGTPTLDGYVTESIDLAGTGTRTSNTDSQVSTTLASIKYAHKVTGQDELGNSLTGSTVTVGGASCTESSGVYYCATTLAADGGTDDVIITKDGYVTYTDDSTDRSASTDVQQTYTSGNQFAFKLTGITTEALAANVTASVSGLVVGDSTGTDTCSLNSGAWYCPVLLANSNEEAGGTVTLDGYVAEALDLEGAGVRSANTDAQVSTTLTNLKYAHKVTGQDELENALTGATVTVGGTSCTESSGVYYCATTLENDGGSDDVSVTKDEFVAFSTNSTNRTANSDAQASYTSSNGVCSLSALGPWNSSCSNDTLTDSNTIVGAGLTYAVSLDVTLSTLINGETMDLITYTVSDLSNNKLTIERDASSPPIKVVLSGSSWSTIVRGTKVNYVSDSNGDVEVTIVSDGSPEDDSVDVVTAGGTTYNMTGVGSTASFDLSEGDLEKITDSGGAVSVEGPAFISSSSSSISGGGGGGSGYIPIRNQNNDDEDEDEEAEIGTAVLPSDAEESWAVDYIQTLYDAGVVEGRSEEAFEPEAPITRAEALKIILLSRGYELLSSNEVSFPDISDNAWYFNYVQTAKYYGLVQGYPDGTFQPNEIITRAEFVKILLYDFVDEDFEGEASLSDIDSDEWYAPYCIYAHELGLDDGDLYFGPGEGLTRAEAAKMAALMM